MGVAKMLHMPIKWRRHHTFVANYAMYKISYIFGTAVPRFSAVICTRTDTVQYTFTVTCSFFFGGGEFFIIQPVMEFLFLDLTTASFLHPA